MLLSERSNERLVALVLCGAIALNYPMLSLLSEASALFGIPVLYLCLFLVLSGFIFLVALNLARKGRMAIAIVCHCEKPRD